MAPEAIESEIYNSKADVFSYAIIMYQVLTDKRPYPILDQKKISGFVLTRRIVENHLRPEFSVEINKSLEKLIKQCWDKDPKARPTFKEIFYKLAYNREIDSVDIFKDLY